MVSPAETLVHEHVTLRRWRAADAGEVHRIVAESLDHLRPWMAWATADYGHTSAASFAEQCERDWAAGDAFNYAVTTGGTTGTTGGTAVGSAGLMRRVGPGGLEIGYWLHPAYTGRGLATTATAALVDAAFGLPDVDRVEIVCDQANVASAAIPRRLGFREVARRSPPQEAMTSAETGVDLVWHLRRADWSPFTSTGRTAVEDSTSTGA